MAIYIVIVINAKVIFSVVGMAVFMVELITAVAIGIDEAAVIGVIRVIS